MKRSIGIVLVLGFSLLTAFELASCENSNNINKPASLSSGTNPTATSTVIPTAQVYQNGVSYPWLFSTACASSTGLDFNSAYTATDTINSDTTVYLIETNGSIQGGASFYSPNATYENDSSYLANGHLQFDIEPIAPSGGFAVTLLNILGASSSVSTGTSPVTVTTSILSSVTTGSWTHISLPLSTAYPPSSPGIYVYSPFTLDWQLNGAPTAGGMLFLIDAIEWSGN
jgi:hypothetical protein